MRLIVALSLVLTGFAAIVVGVTIEWGPWALVGAGALLLVLGGTLIDVDSPQRRRRRS
jgi:hypothetical protein